MYQLFCSNSDTQNNLSLFPHFSLSLSLSLSLSIYLSISLYIYIYIYICVCVCVCRKVQRLTKIVSWNVTKWCLFFNIVPLWSTHLLYQFCRTWISLVKNESTADMAPPYKPFSPSYIYIYIYIYISRYHNACVSLWVRSRLYMWTCVCMCVWADICYTFP